MSVGDSNDVGSGIDVMWVDDGVGVGDGVAGDVDGMLAGDNIGDSVGESSSLLHLYSAVYKRIGSNLKYIGATYCV